MSTKIGADYSAAVQKAHESAAATEALWVNGSPVFGGKDGGIMANPEGAKAANPLTYISKKTAPFLLMHGDADVLVSPSQTELLRAELAIIFFAKQFRFASQNLHKTVPLI